MVRIGDPWAETPTPSPEWQALSDQGRREVVADLLRSMGSRDRVIQATRSGAVVLDMTETMAPSARGTYLWDVERRLKELVDDALTVQLLPKGDINALRKLRGVEVKEWREKP